MHGRRHFLRRVLLGSLDELEKAGRALVGRPAASPGGDQTTPSRVLRPPGAQAEPLFSSMCSRCGECVHACPADCIVMDPGVADGAPHIVAGRSPCVVCEDLSCMKACPSGALKLVDDASQIRMGLAVVDHDRCLRSDGEDCRLCVDQCPFGAGAMTVSPEGRVRVEAGCVGCGVCEQACPTQPPAVIVLPPGSQ